MSNRTMLPTSIKKIQPQKLFAFAALVILYTIFSIFGKNYLSVPTTLNILASAYFIGFLAIGVTFVIISGGIDLSIGTVMMCAALVGGMLYRDYGLPLWTCLVVVVLFGTLCGLLNGMLVTMLKLPPFIATLGMMMVSRGFGSIITGTSSKYYPTILESDG